MSTTPSPIESSTRIRLPVAWAVAAAGVVFGCAQSGAPLGAPSGSVLHELTTSSTSARALYVEAYRLVGDQERVAAIARLRSAVEADPDFAMAWRMLATSLWSEDDTVAGNAAIERARDLRDRVSESERLHIEATMSNRAREWQTSLRAYDRIVEISPFDVMAHNNRGIALRNLGRLDDALAAYDRALDVDDASRITYSNRAIVLARLGRHDEAFEDMKRGSFGRSVDTYQRQRNPKALAFARDSLGRWNTWRWSARTSTEAIANAILACQNRVEERGLEASCSPYAIDDEIVWAGLPPGIHADSIGGTYVLELTAAEACDESPAVGRSRVYTARVHQNGARIGVTLSGARFASDPGAGPQDRFPGVVFGDRVVLDLRAGIVEQITDQNFLFVEGVGMGAVAGDTISGNLAGTLLWGGFPSFECSFEGHRFRLVRWVE